MHWGFIQDVNAVQFHEIRTFQKCSALVLLVKLLYFKLLLEFFFHDFAFEAVYLFYL